MRILLLIAIFIPLIGVSQSKMKKPKRSDARGTFYGYWGYNRDFYTKSDIRFIGPGYDFTLLGSSASDNPERFSFNSYFNPNKITVPQFNTRVGYYFRNHWAASFGYEHMKYIFDDKNEVLLSGEINPGVDPASNWSGTYNNVPVVTDRALFHYENSNGLNYLRLSVERTDNLYQIGNWFMLSTNAALGFGGLLSFNDFNFAGQFDRVTISLSGIAYSAHAGLRFEFFKHFFVQPQLSGGMMHQMHVRTRANDQNSYAKQNFGYLMFDTSVGFLLYLRPTNDCNSCPNW